MYNNISNKTMMTKTLPLNTYNIYTQIKKIGTMRIEKKVIT